MGCGVEVGLLKYPVSIITGGKNLEAVRRMLNQQRGVIISHYDVLTDYRGSAVGYAAHFLPLPSTRRAYVSVAVKHVACMLLLAALVCLVPPGLAFDALAYR